MDNPSTLPAFAEAIKIWFPEMQGRVLAVAEAAITKENVPTLPLCMIALAKETGDHKWRVGKVEIPLTEEFLCEFWMRPERYKREDGSETPFWSFYDYSAIRTRLLNNVLSWQAPGTKARIEYVSLDIEATSFAVHICFTLRAHYNWCPEEEHVDEDDGKPMRLAVNICAPISTCCVPCFEEVNEKDPVTCQ